MKFLQLNNLRAHQKVTLHFIYSLLLSLYYFHLSQPFIYRKAYSDPQPMREELDALYRTHTWVLVDLPSIRLLTVNL